MLAGPRSRPLLRHTAHTGCLTMPVKALTDSPAAQAMRQGALQQRNRCPVFSARICEKCSVLYSRPS
jgi:hypothetical protein